MPANEVNKMSPFNEAVGLKDIILYFIDAFYKATRRGIGRVRLMKLLFLLDYSYLKEKGKKATKVDWIKWHYGPFSREVLDVLDELSIKGYVSIADSDEGIFYEPSEDVEYSIPYEIKILADEIIHENKDIPLEDLLSKIYRIRNVRGKELGERLFENDNF